ncbi:MAG: hypothetical protein AAF389_14185 [Gemmatimonadota bacterium]
MKRWLLCTLAVAVVGCEAEQVEDAVRRIGSELAEMSVSELGDLAARVMEDPSAADSLLAANGVDVAELNAIVDRLGEEAERVGEALSDLPVGDVAELATRISEDRSVADSLLTANGVDAGQLDEVLDRIGPDAEALAAYLAKLAKEQGR